MSRILLRRGRVLSMDPVIPTGVRDVLEFATGGAANAGLADRIGSLTPGKAAEVIVLRTDMVNTAPLACVTGTCRLLGERSTVDAVVVAGQLRKWVGRLVGPDVGSNGSGRHVTASSRRVG
jgi:5-methylthioadenosine/S-adenosylhomocysteine deaminase